MNNITTIQELIEDKIQVLNMFNLNFLDSAPVTNIAAINIQEKQLGRIIYGLLKTHQDQLISLKISNCSKYFHLSFCYTDCSNQPQTTNGLIPPSSTDLLSPLANQVSPFIFREFEDVAQTTLFPCVKELHLRIPLVSPPNSNSAAQLAS